MLRHTRRTLVASAVALIVYGCVSASPDVHAETSTLTQPNITPIIFCKKKPCPPAATYADIP